MIIRAKDKEIKELKDQVKALIEKVTELTEKLDKIAESTQQKKHPKAEQPECSARSHVLVQAPPMRHGSGSRSVSRERRSLVTGSVHRGEEQGMDATIAKLSRPRSPGSQEGEGDLPNLTKKSKNGGSPKHRKSR